MDCPGQPEGVTHQGYFLPNEGANNIAVALFSFPSLAAHEDYRRRMRDDPECRRPYEAAEASRCIVSYEPNFMWPGLGGAHIPFHRTHHPGT